VAEIGNAKSGSPGISRTEVPPSTRRIGAADQIAEEDEPPLASSRPDAVSPSEVLGQTIGAPSSVNRRSAHVVAPSATHSSCPTISKSTRHDASMVTDFALPSVDTTRSPSGDRTTTREPSPAIVMLRLSIARLHRRPARSCTQNRRAIHPVPLAWSLRPLRRRARRATCGTRT
jgi:hypothetical protein